MAVILPMQRAVEPAPAVIASLGWEAAVSMEAVWLGAWAAEVGAAKVEVWRAMWVVMEAEVAVEAAVEVKVQAVKAPVILEAQEDQNLWGPAGPGLQRPVQAHPQVAAAAAVKVEMWAILAVVAAAAAYLAPAVEVEAEAEAAVEVAAEAVVEVEVEAKRDPAERAAAAAGVAIVTNGAGRGAKAVTEVIEAAEATGVMEVIKVATTAIGAAKVIGAAEATRAIAAAGATGVMEVIKVATAAGAEVEAVRERGEEDPGLGQGQGPAQDLLIHDPGPTLGQGLGPGPAQGPLVPDLGREVVHTGDPPPGQVLILGIPDQGQEVLTSPSQRSLRWFVEAKRKENKRLPSMWATSLTLIKNLIFVSYFQKLVKL